MSAAVHWALQALLGDACKRGGFQQVNVGIAYLAPCLVRTAWIYVTALLVPAKKALGPGARTLEELDNVNEANVAWITMQAVAAAASTHGVDDSCIPQCQQDLRKVVGRNVTLLGQIAAQNRGSFRLRSQMCEGTQSMFGSGREHS